jgi:hypothetical protein
MGGGAKRQHAERVERDWLLARLRDHALQQPLRFLAPAAALRLSRGGEPLLNIRLVHRRDHNESGRAHKCEGEVASEAGIG